MTARDAQFTLPESVAKLRTDELEKRIAEQWDKDIVPQITEYIRIPAKSPGFDPDWATNGYLDQAVNLAKTWVEKQNVAGLKLEVIRVKDDKGQDRTPVI